MPRNWIYLIALILILVLRILIVDTTWLAQWVWYRGQADAYYALLALRENPTVLEFVGGWPLPVFIVSAYIYWTNEDNDNDMGAQFLMLPLAYLPFSIVGTMLQNQAIDLSKFFIYPLIIIPAGYLYVTPWVVFVWVFSKLKLVVVDDY